MADLGLANAIGVVEDDVINITSITGDVSLGGLTAKSFSYAGSPGDRLVIRNRDGGVQLFNSGIVEGTVKWDVTSVKSRDIFIDFSEYTLTPGHAIIIEKR